MDSSTVTVKAWFPDANGKVIFPELIDDEFRLPALAGKKDVAVCMSGGGVRATTLALGWLRGLNHLKVLEDVKYLNTISGSSWLGSALCFQKNDIEAFLGSYVEPQNLTMDVLKKADDPRSYAAAVSNANIVKDYVEHVQKDIEATKERDPAAASDEIKAGAWTKAITEAFLKPFGLEDAQKSTVTLEDTKGAVHDRLVGSADGNPATPHSGVYTSTVQKLPLLVIGQVAIIHGEKGDEFFSYEWNPLYAGCGAASQTKPKLAAGWVQTLGHNATLVGDKPDVAPGSSATITVKLAGPTSLGEATGVSSAYASLMLSGALSTLPAQTEAIAAALAAKPPAAEANGAAPEANGTAAEPPAAEANGNEAGPDTEAKGAPVAMPRGFTDALGSVLPLLPAEVRDRLLYLATHPDKLADVLHTRLGYNSANIINLEDWASHRLHVSDGGGTDLFGIYPALRRQVRNIMVLDANNISLDDFEKFTAGVPDIAALFGGVPSKPDDSEEAKAKLATYNANHKVFVPVDYSEASDEAKYNPVDTYKALYDALLKKKKAGQAAVCLTTYKVVDNAREGISSTLPDGSPYTVRVLWVVSDKQDNFEKQLPLDTQIQLTLRRAMHGALDGAVALLKMKAEKMSGVIDKVREFAHLFKPANFDEYPLVNTMSLKYDPELTNLMAAHAAWALVSSADLVKELMSDPPAPAAQPVETPATPASVVVEAVAVEAEPTPEVAPEVPAVAPAETPTEAST